MTTRTTYYVEYGSGNDHSNLDAKTGFTKEAQFMAHLDAVKGAYNSNASEVTWYKAHYVTYEIGGHSVFVEVANLAKVIKPIRELNHALKK